MHAAEQGQGYGKVRGCFFPAVKMVREKEVDDDFCSSTSPTTRQLSAPTTTMVARMVVLKGSVDRHSQSRSPDHQILMQHSEMSRSSLEPPPTSHANCCTPGRSAGRKPSVSTISLPPLRAASACMPRNSRLMGRVEQAQQAPQKGAGRLWGCQRAPGAL